MSLSLIYFGLRQGCSLDLATGWNFAKRSHRKAAWQLLKDQDPDLVILSPECRTESPLRHLSDFKRDPDVVKAEKAAEKKAALAAIQAVRYRSVIMANKKRAMQIKSLKTELDRINVQMGMHDNAMKMLRTARRGTTNELLRIQKDMK